VGLDEVGAAGVLFNLAGLWEDYFDPVGDKMTRDFAILAFLNKAVEIKTAARYSPRLDHNVKKN
jgi:hypothetical protein